jgi:hypothetical protein
MGQVVGDCKAFLEKILGFRLVAGNRVGCRNERQMCSSNEAAAGELLVPRGGVLIRFDRNGAASPAIAFVAA